MNFFRCCIPSSLRNASSPSDEEELDAKPLMNKKNKNSNNEQQQFSFEANNLSKAICNGDISEVKLCLSETTAISINEYNQEGFTALAVAIINHQYKIAKLLLDLGADPNHPCQPTSTDESNHQQQEQHSVSVHSSRQITTPLHIAVETNQIEMIFLLCEYKVQVNTMNSEYKTPLLLAIEKNDWNLVDILFQIGANCFPVDFPLLLLPNNSPSPSSSSLIASNTLSNASLSSIQSTQQQQLLHSPSSPPTSPSKRAKHKTKPAAPSKYIPNAIVVACEIGNDQILRLCIAHLHHEIEVKLQQNGSTSEEISSKKMQEYVSVILQSLHNASDLNCLSICIQLGNLSSFSLLMKYFEPTPQVLYEAVQESQLEIVKYLILEYQMNVNSVLNESQQTSLHIAAFKGHIALIQLLIELGADTTLRDANMKLPLDLAIEQNSVQYHTIARAFRQGLHQQNALKQSHLHSIVNNSSHSINNNSENIFLEGASVSNTSLIGKVYKSRK